MPTHIIIHQRAQDGAVLYRASDGMVLAARQGTIVNFGVDPGKTEQRHFIDKSFSAAYLRQIARLDQLQIWTEDGEDKTRENDASIEDREGDKRIISPADAVGAGLRH